ncbi:MAG: phosphate ABC transporter permease subunit PstC [Myxococcales bacterium]|nr:phosphate ABC transporter permease subunit PstC [Myxococcales bacterium]
MNLGLGLTRKLAGRRATPPVESIIRLFLLGFGVISVITTVGIIYVLAAETFLFFSDVSLADFLFDTEWTPLFADKHFGIWPLLGGTFLSSFIAALFALPLGLLGAIYLSEFAPERIRKIVKPMVELLAGIPTVVYGYFALVFLTPALQNVVPDLSGFNALSPGIIIGIMIIPTIASLSEDAIYAVPVNLREGAYALGASRLSTVFHVVLPAARSGILASVTLAVSRAIGETMVVAIAAGQQPRLTLDPRVPIETMTAYIVKVSMGDTPTGTLEYRTIFAVGATLFLLTLVMNVITQRFARKYRGVV